MAYSSYFFVYHADYHIKLVFYGAYHSNKVNVAIHMICVPILIWYDFSNFPLLLPFSRYLINAFNQVRSNSLLSHSKAMVLP